MAEKGVKEGQILHLYNICWYGSVMGALGLSMYLCGKPKTGRAPQCACMPSSSGVGSCNLQSSGQRVGRSRQHKWCALYEICQLSVQRRVS